MNTLTIVPEQDDLAFKVTGFSETEDGISVDIDILDTPAGKTLYTLFEVKSVSFGINGVGTKDDNNCITSCILNHIDVFYNAPDND